MSRRRDVRTAGSSGTPTRGIRLRPVALLVVVLAVAVGLSASGASVGAEAGGIKQIVIDTQYDQLTADPARDASNSSRYIRGLVYDNLTIFKPKLVNGRYRVNLNRPDPWLAQSYRSSNGGRVWTFNLRRGVVFSDGTPLTSADVVWSLRRVKNIKAAPAAVVETFKTVQAVNRYTVRITTTIPNPAVPYLVSYKGLGIINSKVAKANGATDAPNAARTDKAQAFFDKNSLGSGPYTLRTFSTTGQTVLVRNPRFWGAKKPYYDQLVFRNVKPEIARLNVRSGQSQIAMGLTPDQASTLPGSVRVYTAPSSTVFYMQANFKKSVSELAASPAMWEAIRYGLDYTKLVRLAGKGAIQACGLLPREFLGGLPASACVKRDLARARRALARTGVSNPTLEIEFPTDYVLEGMSFTTISEAVQADLKQVGINVVLRGAPLTAWLPRWIDAKPHMVQGAQAALYPDPNSASAYLPTGYRGQYAGYTPRDAPDLTALGVRAQRELNPQRRAALFRQLQQKFNRESPLIPQFQPSTVIAASSRIKGVVVVPSFFIDPTILSE
jgi:peptide/nickel transport system substrate-binding protein